MAPSPERIPVHDNSSQRTPQFLLWYPSAFDALCRRLPFPCRLPAPHGVATSEESGAHSRSLLGCSEAALQGALLPLLLRFPFLNESWAGAGRAAAAPPESQLWLLPPPVPAGQMKQVQQRHEGKERGCLVPWEAP